MVLLRSRKRTSITSGGDDAELQEATQTSENGEESGKDTPPPNEETMNPSSPAPNVTTTRRSSSPTRRARSKSPPPRTRRSKSPPPAGTKQDRSKSPTRAESSNQSASSTSEKQQKEPKPESLEGEVESQADHDEQIATGSKTIEQQQPTISESEEQQQQQQSAVSVEAKATEPDAKAEGKETSKNKKNEQKAETGNLDAASKEDSDSSEEIPGIEESEPDQKNQEPENDDQIQTLQQRDADQSTEESSLSVPVESKETHMKEATATTKANKPAEETGVQENQSSLNDNRKSNTHRVGPQSTLSKGPASSDASSPTAMQKSTAVNAKSQSLKATLPRRVTTSKKGQNKKTPRNELTSFIPGYTARLQLDSSSSLKGQRPGLEALRKRALVTDKSTARFVKGTLANQQRTQTAFAVAKPKAEQDGKVVKSSFKLGTKRDAPNHAGDQWFGFVPTPMTEDVKRDLKMIRYRNNLDPKRFYKSADTASKYVQVGTVVEGNTEYYSSRLTKKERRANLTEELMADPTVADYVKRKHKTMQQEKGEPSRKRQRQMKSKKRGKRYHA